MRKYGLKIKLPKCQSMIAGTKYQGFSINQKGIKPDDDKVEVICSVSEPKTFRQVWGFVGAIGYYRRFIPAFSRIATPLIALTKKGVRFKWTDDCQRSFDMLKGQLTTILLLAHPDMNKLMILYTDVSNWGMHNPTMSWKGWPCSRNTRKNTYLLSFSQIELYST